MIPESHLLELVAQWRKDADELETKSNEKGPPHDQSLLMWVTVLRQHASELEKLVAERRKEEKP